MYRFFMAKRVTVMKKFLLTGVLILSVAFMTACSDSKEEKSTTTAASVQQTTLALDNAKADELAKALVDGGVFEGEMAAVDSAIVKAKYELEDSVECVVTYRSSTMNPEEITILKSDSDLTDQINTYLDTQKTSYDSYMPEQVKKIENVIRKTSGSYTVIVVCNDTAKANEILAGYIN